MPLVRRLLAQMNVHDAGAGVEGCFGLARHFLRRYRDVMLFGVGQHAVQRAGDDSLVAHGLAFDSSAGGRRGTLPRIMRPAPVRFLRPCAIAGSGPRLRPTLPEPGPVGPAWIAAVNP